MTRNIALTVIAVIGLCWLIDFYDTSLRDPRFLDGWILTAAMLAQLAFHVRKRLPALPIGKAATWLRLHTYMGYFTVAAILLHCQFTLPDTTLEWLLWILFILVALSGVLGVCLSRSIPGIFQEEAAEPISLEHIPASRSRLARQLDALILGSVKHATSPAISDFYTERLHDFFRKPQSPMAHLRGSKQPLRSLISELDDLERSAGGEAGETLATVKQLVNQKFNLDRQWTLQGLLQIWLFVHVPATYCLIVLSALHIAVVYAYSSGVH